MFIVLEGVDGCGKSTTARMLADRMRGEMLSFPNDAGYTGPAIRAYLANEWRVSSSGNVTALSVSLADQLSAMAFQALQVVNRLEVMPLVAEAKKSPTRHIVAARYWQSGFVYGSLDGLDPEWLRKIHASLVQPDLSVLLDISSQFAESRRSTRVPDRYERQSAFLADVIREYRLLWRQEMDVGWQANWRIVDATFPTPSEVVDTIESLALGMLRVGL